MEDTLRVDKRIIIIEPDGVLILVLMEDTLRERTGRIVRADGRS